jgi:hypothetical protein
MGGRGSGGHNSKGKRRDVQCARLDVHELARDGKLKLGTRGWLFRAILFEVTGGPVHGSWCWSFLASPPPANHWIRYGRSFAAIGEKHISVADTSCSPAPNAIAQSAFCLLGTHTTASSFSVAANAVTSPIRQWVTDGTARRAVLRSCGPGSNGAQAVPCRSKREVCMSGRTSVSWGCLPITRLCEFRDGVTAENTDQISIVLICGGNAEIDSLTWVVGRFVNRRALANIGVRTRLAPVPIHARFRG